MKLSVAIQAHPTRVAEVGNLLNALDRRSVQVAWDDEGPPSGNAERGWRTARRAWQLADPDADFHLVLQDDAVPCRDLLAGLEQALDHVPEVSVVSAYMGKGGAVPDRWRRMAAEADDRAASWVLSHKLMWGVAIILPVKLIDEMIQHADTRVATTDDMRVAGWAEKRHAEVWYCWPSLVDHSPVPSLTKHRAKNRVAWRHHQGSALELDWTGPVVRDSVMPSWTRPRSAPRGDRQVTSSSTALGTGKAGKRA